MTALPPAPSDAALATVVRAEAARLVAVLHRRFGDFDVAEEAVQAAIVAALVAWRRDGLPANPAAWLTTAATRKGLDQVRERQRAAGARRRLLPGPDAPTATPAREEDDRLALLFACCHPALAVEARLALTMRAVVGLTTAQIARAFLQSERTVAQRIVRAKRKIVANRIALEVPSGASLTARVGDVLRVVYLMYNEAFVSSTGPTQDRDLAADALWLAEQVTASLPRPARSERAEALGLAALITLQHARAAARFTPSGDLIRLEDQDRSRWDHAAVSHGIRLLERAGELRAPGPYQLHAAIAACHAEAASFADTDWLQIVALYRALATYDASPVVRLNLTIAQSRLHPDLLPALLRSLDALAPDLDGYHLFHATRGDLLRRMGHTDAAAEADGRAFEIATNTSERRLLATRLHRDPLSDGS